MKRIDFILACSVCGEDGFGDIECAVEAWLGGVVHTNRNVCRDNLARKRKKKQEHVDRQHEREEAMRDAD